MRYLSCFLCFCISFVIGGCGYRFSAQNSRLIDKTFSVPYICGDRKGFLTSDLIRELTISGYCFNQCGDAELNVSILSIWDKNIGFRYERDANNQIKKTIVPSETRLTAEVEVEVIDANSRSFLVKPFIILAEAEFDHEYYSSPDNINETSLGQLTDIDSAKEAAMRPLYRTIARKIVEHLNYSF